MSSLRLKRCGLCVIWAVRTSRKRMHPVVQFCVVDEIQYRIESLSRN